MNKTIRNIALWAVMAAQLSTTEPVMAQNLQDSKQNLIENFEDNKATMNNSMQSILSNNKNSILYFTKQNTKAYNDAEGKEEIWVIPEGTYLRKNQINTEESNEDYISCTFRDKKIRIPTAALQESDDNLAISYLKPKTEKSIVVDKINRRMLVYGNYGKQLLKEFKIALSPWGEWDKIIEGDWNTPEGKYYVCYKNPASSFWTHPQTGKRLGSLQVSYPNLQDATEGLISWDINKAQYQGIKATIQKKGIPSQWTSLWNYIMVHWGGSDYDWTAWCMALENEDMLWLYTNIWSWTDMFIW